MENQNGSAPASRAEFASACSLLVDALQTFWQETRDQLRMGMSGDRLRERCREGMSVADRVLAVISSIAALPENSQALEFSNNAQAAGRVRDEFQQLIDWAAFVPPPLNLEKLQAAESGPFVHLKDLQTRHESHDL